MKIVIYILILNLVALNLFATDGHKLWLSGKSTGSVNIRCSKNSTTLDIAKQELN